MPTTERLVKAEWEVRNVAAHGEVLRLLRAWHYSGGGANTSTYRHGLYRAGELLSGDAWGVALWLPPTRAAAEALAGDDWQGVLTLSRLAVDPAVPTNGASFLMGRSIRLIPRDRWPVLVTYADKGQGHSGGIYKATNWRCDGEVPAGDVWEHAVSGRLQGRKRGGRSRTVAEMQAEGFTRRPTLPKIRFVIDRRHAI